MRKLLTVICLSVLLIFLAAPAFAQQNDFGKRLEKLENTIGAWNFYGSIRLLAIWEEQTETTIGFKGSTPTGGDRDLTFDLQDNTRLGALVKKGNLSAGYEIALDDTDALETRIAYAKWTFDNGIGLLIGQHYTPAVVDVSDSIAINDNSYMWSVPYNGRRPQFTLSYGGLRVGLVKQHAQYVISGAPADAEIDTTIPKIEASYTYRPTKKAWFTVVGGYQTYALSSEIGEEYDIDSYVIGAAGKMKFGPASVAACVWTGQNTAPYGLLSAAKWTGANKSAIRIEADGLKDEQVLGVTSVATFDASKALSFEAGAAYQKTTSDRTGYTEDDETIGYYLQSRIKVSKYLWFIPEIGYFDYKDDLKGADQGQMWYAGIQTRIDF
ncbi:MAG: hypothetical protein JXA41_04555 [Deltaproteobacteria bacterium]|nr:hypothetical protein [Deltaproteobacteria bacterium]